jgi:hypothetical protein
MKREKVQPRLGGAYSSTYSTLSLSREERVLLSASLSRERAKVLVASTTTTLRRIQGA